MAVTLRVLEIWLSIFSQKSWSVDISHHLSNPFWLKFKTHFVILSFEGYLSDVPVLARTRVYLDTSWGRQLLHKKKLRHFYKTRGVSTLHVNEEIWYGQKAVTLRVLEIRLSFFFCEISGTLEVSRDNIRMCTHQAHYLSSPIWLKLKTQFLISSFESYLSDVPVRRSCRDFLRSPNLSQKKGKTFLQNSWSLNFTSKWRNLMCANGCNPTSSRDTA